MKKLFKNVLFYVAVVLIILVIFILYSYPIVIQAVETSVRIENVSRIMELTLFEEINRDTENEIDSRSKLAFYHEDGSIISERENEVNNLKLALVEARTNFKVITVLEDEVLNDLLENYARENKIINQRYTSIVEDFEINRINIEKSVIEISSLIKESGLKYYYNDNAHSITQIISNKTNGSKVIAALNKVMPMNKSVENLTSDKILEQGKYYTIAFFLMFCLLILSVLFIIYRHRLSLILHKKELETTEKIVCAFLLISIGFSIYRLINYEEYISVLSFYEEINVTNLGTFLWSLIVYLSNNIYELLMFYVLTLTLFEFYYSNRADNEKSWTSKLRKEVNRNSISNSEAISNVNEAIQQIDNRLKKFESETTIKKQYIVCDKCCEAMETYMRINESRKTQN